MAAAAAPAAAAAGGAGAAAAAAEGAGAAAPRRRIVVCGGTGRQGGWVARHLLKSAQGFEVVTISRTPRGADALAVAALGVEVVYGDINDRASLLAAFEGAYGVYGVTNPFLSRFNGRAPKADTAAESQQGRNIIEACFQRGVRHLVLASVASAGESTGVPAFDSKWAFEQHLAREAAAGRAPPTTVLAPVGFIENFESNFAGLRQGVVPSLLSRGRKVQLVSVEDVAWFACAAFERPADFVGRRVELAGDELSAEEVCACIARVRGEPGRWHVVSPPEILLRLVVPTAVASLRRFLEERGCHVDIEALRREHPDLLRFEDWLLRHGYNTKVLPPAGWAACAVA